MFYIGPTISGDEPGEQKTNQPKGETMKLENQKVIQGELDNCQITPKPDDRLFVGSITMKRSEAAGFLAALQSAFAELGLLAETK